MSNVVQMSVQNDARADERRVLLDTRSRPYRGFSLVASVARELEERMARIEVFRDGMAWRVLRQPVGRVGAFEGEFHAMVDGWMRTPLDVPSELEMHRADYEAVKAAGFESPGELLAAYRRLAAEKGLQRVGGMLCRHKKTGRIYQVHSVVLDCTHSRDGTVAVTYSVAGKARATFVREASEFSKKFEVSFDALAQAIEDMRAATGVHS